MIKRNELPAYSPSPDITYYGFKYTDVQATMNRYMPYVFEDINHLVDELMRLSNADFVCDDDTDDGSYGYTDTTLYYRAHLEIIRQLCGFLFQCLPPIISSVEPPFLLPHQLVPEYVDSWMSDLANNGHDYRERLFQEWLDSGGLEDMIQTENTKAGADNDERY